MICGRFSTTLTTSDLAALDLDVDVNREQPEDVARAYLQSKNLLD